MHSWAWTLDTWVCKRAPKYTDKTIVGVIVGEGRNSKRRQNLTNTNVLVKQTLEAQMVLVVSRGCSCHKAHHGIQTQRVKYRCRGLLQQDNKQTPTQSLHDAHTSLQSQRKPANHNIHLHSQNHRAITTQSLQNRVLHATFEVYSFIKTIKLQAC